MSTVQELSLCERNAHHELTERERRTILMALWRRYLARYKKNKGVPDRFLEAEEYAQMQRIVKKYLFIIFYCAEAEYSSSSNLHAAKYAISELVLEGRMPYSALRVYERKILDQA